MASILILDDEPGVRGLLVAVAESAGHRVIEASDSQAGLRLAGSEQPDLVLADILMPGMDGYDFVRELRRDPKLRSTRVVFCTATFVEDEVRRLAASCGVEHILAKPFEVQTILDVIERGLSAGPVQSYGESPSAGFEREHLRILNAKLIAKLEELEDAHLETLRRLALAAEYRDDGTLEHPARVARTSLALAQALGLPERTSVLIGQAAPLHDLGKLAVPDAILLKPGKLTREEFQQIERHTTAGAEILAGSASEVLQVAETIALTHHEHWDGRGYPARLKGEEIPLSGRIVALADVFDALTHARPYKDAWPVEEAVAEIFGLSARQFDAAIVEAFIELDPGRFIELPHEGGDLAIVDGRGLTGRSSRPAAFSHRREAWAGVALPAVDRRAAVRARSRADSHAGEGAR